MSDKKFNLRDIDFNNPGSMPAPVRIVLCVFTALLVVIVAWYAMIGSKRDELSSLEQKEADLRTQYEEVAEKSANLPALKKQLADLESQLQTVLRQLPSKTEMPDLIVDISQTALGAGINTELFQPQQEVIKEFYAEKPIAVRMVGTYHQFGSFVSGVASLPRMVIMTMQDITLQPRKGDKTIVVSEEGVPLELVSTIKTYRYLDDEETAEQEAIASEKEKAEKAKAKKKAGADKKAEEA